MPLIPLLLGLAPTVASWIFGDKTGKAVDTVTGIVKRVTGTDDASEIERAIATDPNLALQLKSQLIQAEAEARRAEHEEVLALIADVGNARQQTMDLAKSGSAIAWGAPVMSTLILVAFGVMLYVVLTRQIPEAALTMANVLLGTLAAMATQVVNYWLGSSRGSAQKDVLLAQQTGK